LRIDALPQEVKQQVRDKINQHLEWLEPIDKLSRATTGFRAMLTFMDAEEKQDLLPKFFEKTFRLDNLRGENFYNTFPELEGLKKYEPTI
jgi:hypothetical protein